MNLTNPLQSPEGILLLNKPVGKTSFSLVGILRKLLKVKKIGHAGTLDPFASGVMVMLIGKTYTRLSDSFLTCEKEYRARLLLGVETDSYDCTGQVIQTSPHIPCERDVEHTISLFQGDILQVPPMFSAKKINGQKLYELARKGKEIERKPVLVNVQTHLIKYEYPYIDLRVVCSKGTYIRSLAHDIGQFLNCGAHLTELVRTRSGDFSLDQCLDGALTETNLQDVLDRLLTQEHLLKKAI